MTIYISSTPTNTILLLFVDLVIFNVCRYLVIENAVIYWG